MDQLNCFICEQRVLNGLDGLSRHFRINHGMTITRGIPGGFICGQNNCRRHFVNFFDLRRHIRNVHQVDQVNVQIRNDEMEVDDFRENNDNGQNENFAAIYNLVADIPNGHLQNNIADNRFLDDPIDVNNSIKNILRPSVVKMISKFHCNSSINGRIVTNILEECEELLFQFSNCLKTKLIARIREQQPVHDAFLAEVNNTFDFESSFNNLKTYEKQIDSLIENCGYIEPREILLGYRMDNLLDKETCEYVPTRVPESFQYIPIIEVIKLVLSNEQIRQTILTEEASPDGILASSIDGQHFKTHPFFQKYKQAIRLKLYYDELEIVNPLGSKTGIHMLGVFYYILENIQDHINAELSSIHVLIICNNEDVKKYKFHRILTPFLEDLRKLESDEGVLVDFNGEPFTLRASIMNFCGDGLAVHEVFNLLGPSANRFCRSCMYSRDDLHAASLDLGLERTEELYNEHYALLERTRYSQITKTATGVHGRCPLNESRYFHISRNKNFDIMHDCLCGVCPMVIKLVLHEYIINQQLFDVAHFNSRISAFNYGYVENKNKPSANFTNAMLNKREHTLSQKAMQIWCLIRSIPFLLSDTLDEDDEYMDLILHLLRIMEIAFAPKTTISLMPYFHELIKEFCMLFSRLFPLINWINKFLHLLHYVANMIWAGPIQLNNCTRFEAKYSETKLRAQNVHNFKNPPKTLIRISQCIQSMKWGSGNIEIDNIQTRSAAYKFVNSTVSSNDLILLGYDHDDLILSVNSCVVNGIEYRKNLFVVLEKACDRDGDLHLFGRIEEILVLNDNQVYLKTSVCTTIDFNTMVHAYEIEINNVQYISQFRSVSDFTFKNTFSSWRKPFSISYYISLRHIIL